MKQGKATTSTMGSTKQEPISRAVNPEAVAEMGAKETRIGRASSVPLYEGRGLKAPMSGTQTHQRGSQGKH